MPAKCALQGPGALSAPRRCHNKVFTGATVGWFTLCVRCLWLGGPTSQQRCGQMHGRAQSENRQARNWAGLGWLFLFFWYFSGVTHLLIQLTGTTGFEGFRQAFLMSALWLIPVLLFPARARAIAGGIGLVLWLCSLIGLGYFCIYGQQFSQSVIFILFESNLAEGGEYFAQYFAWWMVPVYLGYSLVAWLLWTRVRPLAFPPAQARVLSLLLVAGLLVYPLGKQLNKQPTLRQALEKFEARVEPAVPWQLLVGYRKYREQLGAMQSMLADNARIARAEE